MPASFPALRLLLSKSEITANSKVSSSDHIGSRSPAARTDPRDIVGQRDQSSLCGLRVLREL